MVQLVASYFFSGEEPVHLNDLLWRRMGARGQDLTQWWVLPYLPGRRYMNKKVYILTSRRTFSGGEEFTYDLQMLKRATVVGEPTGGGANPGSPSRLSDHFLAFIPRGHAVNPITRTNWEGRGVQPDMRVAQEKAFRAAYRAALSHLLAETRNEQELANVRQALVELQSGSERSPPLP